MPADISTMNANSDNIRLNRSSAAASLSPKRVPVALVGSSINPLKIKNDDGESPKARFSTGSLLAAVMAVSSSSKNDPKNNEESVTSVSLATDAAVTSSEHRPSHIKEQLKVSDISDMLGCLDISTSMRNTSTRTSEKGSTSPNNGSSKPLAKVKFYEDKLISGTSVKGDDIAADIAIAMAANFTTTKSHKKGSMRSSDHGGGSGGKCSTTTVLAKPSLVRKTKSMGDRAESNAAPTSTCSNKRGEDSKRGPRKMSSEGACKNTESSSSPGEDGLDDKVSKIRRSRHGGRRIGKSESVNNRESLRTSRSNAERSPASPRRQNDDEAVAAPSRTGMSQSARDPRPRPRRTGSIEARMSHSAREPRSRPRRTGSVKARSTRRPQSRAESVGVRSNSNIPSARAESVEASRRPCRTGSVQIPRTTPTTRGGSITLVTRTRSASLSVMTRGRGVGRTRSTSVSQKGGVRITSLSPMSKRSPRRQTSMASSTIDSSIQPDEATDAMDLSSSREQVDVLEQSPTQNGPTKRISGDSRRRSPKGEKSGKASRSPRRREGGRRKDSSNVLQNQLQQAVLSNPLGFSMHDYADDNDNDSEEMNDQTNADKESQRHNESLQKTLGDLRRSINPESTLGGAEKKQKEWKLFPVKSRIVTDLGDGSTKVTEKAFGVAAAVEIARAKVAEVGAAMRRPSLSSQSPTMDDSSSNRSTYTSERTTILGPQIVCDSEDNDESVEFF